MPRRVGSGRQHRGHRLGRDVFDPRRRRDASASRGRPQQKAGRSRRPLPCRRPRCGRRGPCPRIALPAANTPGRLVWKVPRSTRTPRSATASPQRPAWSLAAAPQAISTASKSIAEIVERGLVADRACSAATRRPSARICAISASSTSRGSSLGRELRPQPPAGHVAGVEERHGVSLPREVVRGGQAGRPGADDRHPLARGRAALGQVRRRPRPGRRRPRSRFSRQMATAPSASPRRQPFSHGAGQTRPSTAGRAMSRLTVTIASAEVARRRSAGASAGCPSAPGRRSWHGARQSPTWSLSSSSSAARRTRWTSSRLALDLHAVDGRACAQEGTRRPFAAELDQADQARGRRLAAVEDSRASGCRSPAAARRRAPSRPAGTSTSRCRWSDSSSRSASVRTLRHSTPRSTASAGQTWRQVSQRVHFSRSIVCRA